MDRNPLRLSSNFRNALFIVLLLAGTPAAAQQPGSISATVTDSSHARLPGVMVTLTSPALQVPEVTKLTDEAGAYQFTELPVGTYRLAFDLTGFGQLVRKGIQISTGFAARVDATLTVAQFAETVTVSGESPLVDLINTRGGAALNKDLLQNLPVTNNYQDVLNLMPGITFAASSPYRQIAGGGIGPSSFKTYGVDRGSRFSAAGGSSMTPMIEGIETRTGGSPDFATVEEVAARTYGNTAEVTRPGPALQFVVKSGGNDFFLQRFGPLAYAVTTWRWHDLNGDKRYEPGEVNLDPNGPDFLSISGGNLAPSSFKHAWRASALHSHSKGRSAYAYMDRIDRRCFAECIWSGGSTTSPGVGRRDAD